MPHLTNHYMDLKRWFARDQKTMEDIELEIWGVRESWWKMVVRKILSYF